MYRLVPETHSLAAQDSKLSTLIHLNVAKMENPVRVKATNEIYHPVPSSQPTERVSKLLDSAKVTKLLKAEQTAIREREAAKRSSIAG